VTPALAGYLKMAPKVGHLRIRVKLFFRGGVSRAIFRFLSDEDLSSVDDERMAGHHAGVVGAEKDQRSD